MALLRSVCQHIGVRNIQTQICPDSDEAHKIRFESVLKSCNVSAFVACYLFFFWSFFPLASSNTVSHLVGINLAYETLKNGTP